MAENDDPLLAAVYTPQRALWLDPEDATEILSDVLHALPPVPTVEELSRVIWDHCADAPQNWDNTPPAERTPIAVLLDDAVVAVRTYLIQRGVVMRNV